jgi:hypothetical protein
MVPKGSTIVAECNCSALVSSFPQAACAPLVHSHSTPTAIAVTQRTRTRLARSTSRCIKAVVAVPWTGTTTGTACSLVIIGHGRVASTSTNGDWHTLNDPALTWSMTREHAIVDGEVAADHVSSGGCSILRKLVTLVVYVG